MWSGTFRTTCRTSAFGFQRRCHRGWHCRRGGYHVFVPDRIHSDRTTSIRRRRRTCRHHLIQLVCITNGRFGQTNTFGMKRQTGGMICLDIFD